MKEESIMMLQACAELHSRASNVEAHASLTAEQLARLSSAVYCLAMALRQPTAFERNLRCAVDALTGNKGVL